MLRHAKITWAWVWATGAAALLVAQGTWAQPGSLPAVQQRQMQEVVLQWGYLQSQYAVQNPPDILGGPIQIRLRQDAGGVRVVLPASRQGSQPITTVASLSQGRFMLQAVDATATDAARTRDTVSFQASWNDPQGNTYAVRCNRVLPRGIEHPVFGGVVTNQVLSDFNGRGMPALPAGFTYVAFWGTGDAFQNGRIAGRSVVVHAALMEVSEGNRPGAGEPGPALRRQFHVLVLPSFRASSAHTAVQRNVSTGNVRVKGGEQPCWHVVFDNPQVVAARAPSVRQTRLASPPPGGLNLRFSGAPAVPGAAAVVEMTNLLQYAPRDIRIAVGRTVEWRNPSHLTHTVTCDPSLAIDPRDVQLPEGAEPFNSGVMRPGAVFRYTFKTPGLYKYFCIPHEYAGMVGTVDVIGQP
jgi:plastocyanin